MAQVKTSEKEARVVELPAQITVRELAQKLGVNPIQLIKTLISIGELVSINATIDYDTASLVAGEFGIQTRPAWETTAEAQAAAAEEALPLWRRWLQEEPPDQLRPRPPVVAVLGHVDHGKTTLLDAIRKTNVAQREAGGITQHIGAYQVEYNGQKITFLDTPGHAAFTQMRARGAKGADIVVLVVAADDGIMPQTREAIDHARAAQVPIVVAINKIDKPNARPQIVRRQLADLGLTPDEWGGETIMVEVSAKQGIGLDELLEAILLVAEQADLKANPQGRTFGTVIEAKREKGRGVVATLLVQNGTLRVGDMVVAGTVYGRIRAMFDHQGKRVREAGPSTPVSVLGLHDLPQLGTLFYTVQNEKEAKRIVEERLAEEEARKKQGARPAVTLEDLLKKMEQGEVRALNLVIKVDVEGSLEPIVQSIQRIAQNTGVDVHILRADVGDITKDDVMLAATAKGIVIGFNVKPDAAARRTAEAEGVQIRRYRVIYDLLDDVERALRGLLEPEEQEVFLGEAEVLAVFPASRFGRVAGCRVRRGVLRRGAQVRVKRGEQVVFEGEITSLKRFQEDVKEVREGYECGVGIRGFKEYQVGDILYCYTVEKA